MQSTADLRDSTEVSRGVQTGAQCRVFPVGRTLLFWQLLLQPAQPSNAWPNSILLNSLTYSIVSHGRAAAYGSRCGLEKMFAPTRVL